MRRHTTIAVGLLAALVLGSCGGSPSSSSTSTSKPTTSTTSTSTTTTLNPSASDVGPVVFHGFMKTTGLILTTLPFTDSLTAKNVASCTQAAAAGDVPAIGPNTWAVPTPAPGNPVILDIRTGQGGYHGPGAFPQSTFVQGKGTMVIAQETYDLASPNTIASMTVRSDGSGEVTFTHVPATSNSPTPGRQGAVSGTINWTCSS